MNQLHSLLPKIETSAQFSAVFKQSELWLPAIRAIVDRHSIQGELERAKHGSHIVYRVGDVWIKLMAPIYAQDMEYEIGGLKSIPNNFPFQTPKILFSGDLESWPYVVLSHVAGERIGDHFQDMGEQQKLQLAIEIGKAVRTLQSVQADYRVANRIDWNLFIRHQFQNLQQHHLRMKLPQPWLEELIKFMGRFRVDQFECAASVFLHSDLTFDHFFVEKNSTGAYQLRSIIDFADCRVGHPEYELAASAIFLFKGQSTLLRAFVGEAMVSSIVDPVQFSKKLMAWTILHQYSNLQLYFANEMQQLQEPNFDELVKLVFPLSNAGDI